MAINKGDLVRLYMVFEDGGGVAVDPTTVTFQSKTPSSTTTSNTAIKDSVGNYHYDVNVTEVGRWYYRFNGTGANQSAEESFFDVKPTQF